MKLYYSFHGQFERQLSPQSGEESQTDVLWQDWLNQVHFVSRRCLSGASRSRQSVFGLDFLPANSLSLSHPLAQLSSLSERASLRPWLVSSSVSTTHRYEYYFSSSQIKLLLSPDDPQLPNYWPTQETVQPGNYRVLLSSPEHSLLGECLSQQLWSIAKNAWQQRSPLEQIHLMVQSRTNDYLYLLGVMENLDVVIESQDLSELQYSVVQALRSHDNSQLGIEAQALLQSYQNQYQTPVFSRQEPHWQALVSPNESQSFRIVTSSHQRRQIQEIIQSAEQFLLLSSFVIEDEEAVNLICRQSLQLEQGVWLLVNLEDLMLDRFEKKTGDEVRQRLDWKKKQRLRELLQANVNIRSSNIHLKAYLSEKIGCLSSVNLTPGSLDINLESSLFLIGGSDHQNLVDWFKFIWQRQSRATIFSNQNLDEFISRCLPSSNMEEFPRATSFLMPRQYYHDLVSSLKDFHGRV